MVDLACMRDAMNKLGGDSNKINPLVSIFLFFKKIKINKLLKKSWFENVFLYFDLFLVWLVMWAVIFVYAGSCRSCY